METIPCVYQLCTILRLHLHKKIHEHSSFFKNHYPCETIPPPLFLSPDFTTSHSSSPAHLIKATKVTKITDDSSSDSLLLLKTMANFTNFQHISNKPAMNILDFLILHKYCRSKITELRLLKIRYKYLDNCDRKGCKKLKQQLNCLSKTPKKEKPRLSSYKPTKSGSGKQKKMKKKEKRKKKKADCQRIRVKCSFCIKVTNMWGIFIRAGIRSTSLGTDSGTSKTRPR